MSKTGRRKRATSLDISEDEPPRNRKRSTPREKTVACAEPPPTIRLSGIPQDDIQGFKTWIDTNAWGGGLVSWSLAPSISSRDDHWVATLTFKALPEVFQKCGALKEGEYVKLRITERTLDLFADTHFFGITPLCHAENPTVE
jgi:hypothetical protein